MTATAQETHPIEGEDYVVATEPSGLVRVEHAAHGLLTIDPAQTTFTDVQRVALKAMGIETEGDEAVPVQHVLLFLHQCQTLMLDPYLKQAYLIPNGKITTGRNGQRYDNRKFLFVIGIDGFRRRGALAGGDDYSGVTSPEWASEDEQWHSVWSKKWAAPDAEWGQPLAARVGIVKRHDPQRPTYGVAMWDEYVPMMPEYVDVLDKNGKKIWEGNRPKSEATGRTIPTDMWRKMPAGQLEKCGEAKGWRKAYPDTFSGVYTPEEAERGRVEYEEARREAADRERDARARRAIAVSAPKKAAEPVEGVVMDRQPAAAPGPTPRAKTVRSEVVQHPQPGVETRDALLRAEVRAVCALAGKDVEWLVARRAAAEGVPYDEWSIETLEDYVYGSLRKWGADVMASVGVGDPEVYAALGRHPITDLDAVGLADPEA